MKDYQSTHGDNKFPPFGDFVKFVADNADVQCLPVLVGLNAGKPMKDGKEESGPRKPYERRTRSKFDSPSADLKPRQPTLRKAYVRSTR